ncbi:SDR family oxidoreductase [Fictibacillus phosphorivorans]|uniref:SDR family oxidoreductase n=1 Tax=Fictibacillus phosphorivorans TaxID=1221500 RepID=UPI00203CB42C|nr:SDR family oxidoreductase [Fictibacillus phosphorivorans]MCM3718781.1 SDR family oxidoreductase [Fictibacillus phosphorivorans]MCM3776404.1 SDR family oxidoreductase [Fictibacillus phosphorivorans]
MNTRPLKGKTALITGASRLNGIGAAACLQLAQKGANIFFTTWGTYDNQTYKENHQSDPTILVKKLEGLGVETAFMEIDLADPKQFPDLFHQVEQKIGQPSILVNNACFSEHHPWKETTSEMLDKHYTVNLRATTLLSVEFAKRLKGTDGSIIHLTSGQSKGPMIGELAYAATKGAIEALTVTMAAELGSKGIRVNAVNPGPTDTGWMTEDLKKALLPKFPLGRVGKPEDAARLIAFLASPEAEWITGQVIHSEGGFLRQ